MSDPQTARAPDRGRLLASLAIVPIVDALAATVAFPQWPDRFAVLAAIAGLLVMLSGGLPVFYWLLRRGPVTFTQIAVAGMALGNVPLATLAIFGISFALVHLVMGTLSEHLVPISALLTSVLYSLAVGSGMGLVSAVAFWFVAVRSTEATR